MSPEICAAERYSHHSDIWSLGCIIYELASRCVPFDARNHVELIMKIKAGKIKPLPPQYSRELGEVIAWCLKVDPRYRPDTAQLLNVANIKLARSRLHQQEQSKDAQVARDLALVKLSQAQKQILELQQEVRSLREQGKKVEMEWHARATLAIDQRVYEQVEAKKAELLKQFDSAVDQRAEEKLSLHLASLPASHGLNAGQSTHVRSSTPPPGKVTSSFTTTGTTAVNDIDFSSVPGDLALDDSALDTDLTSLSLHDEILEDETSPLVQRMTKPIKKAVRKPLGRAKTYANCDLNTMALPSPLDVDMADPSPMPRHVAPMSIKGLSLSPRKNGQTRLSGAGDLRRNILSKQNTTGHDLRPHVPGESRGATTIFADDIEDESELLDDDGNLDDSPSRPNSGLAIHNGADPFQVLAAAEPPRPKFIPRPRPSLSRQKTMPVSMPSRPGSSRGGPTATTNAFTSAAAGGFKATPKGPEREKENRPPSSSSHNPSSLSSSSSALPTITTAPSPKPRNILPPSSTKALTPSRKAPAPPTAKPGINAAAALTNLARQAHKNNHPTTATSPAKSVGVQGRTLVQLQQARSQPQLVPTVDSGDWESGEDGGVMGSRVPRLLPSPAKWDPVEMGDEMPSPFLAKKGRRMMGVLGRG